MRPRAHKEDTKIRVIAVYRILLRGQRITSTQILRELELHYGITCDRKTLYGDIAAIDRFVPIDAQAGPGGGYCIYDVLGRCAGGNTEN